MVLQYILIAAISLAVLVGLPVLVTLHLLQNHDSKAGGEDAPAWWHKHAAAMGSGGGGGGAGAAYGGKLVGGSRQMPQLDKCAQCDVDRPAYRCKGCSSVAFCSRDCQKANWLAGHKQECSKLRKQLQQQVRLEAAEAAAAAGNSLALPAESKARDSKDRPVESNSTPPVPLKVLFPTERYAGLAVAPPKRHHPLGLQNVGNSCYANSLLQSLMATPPLAAYLVSGEHGRGCVKPSPSDWCVLCELEKLAVQAYAGNAKVLNPRPLLLHVKRLGKQFTFGRQECSHELFLRMTEAIEAVQLLEAGGKAKYDLRSRETTFIHHLFAGYTRNQVECLSCGHISRTYECCTSLPLEVGAHVASLEAALARFAATERLDGDNRYKCDGCKQYVSAEKSTRLEAAPHCLQICLKRFAVGRFGKITSRLSFPEQLDLEPYMAEGCVDRAPKLYSLYAVVQHIDFNRSTNYGHYIAYVKCGDSWFLCDDSTVTPVAAAKALAAGAYLLFYERQAPRRIVPKLAAAPSENGQAVEAGAVSTDAAAAAATGEQQAAEGEGLAGSVAGQQGQLQVQQEAQAQHGKQQQQQEQQQPEGMLRVETAPASLPHMQSPGAADASASPASADAGDRTSSAALSAAPSQAQLLAEVEDGGIELGLRDGRLHASASDSDVAVSRQRAAAAMVQHARRELEQQQQQGHGAAAEPPSQQQAALQQAADQCSTGGDSDASDTSSASEFGPSVNPYNLLGSSGSGSEASSSNGEELSRSRAGDSGTSSEPMGSQEMALQDFASMCSHAGQGQQHLAAAVSAEQQPSAAGRDGLKAAEPDSPSAAASTRSSAPAAQAARCTPAHEAAVSKLPSSGKRVLRVAVALPGVDGEAAVDWLVHASRSGTRQRQTLLLHARQYELALPMPVPVAGAAGKAAWAAADECLTLTWPVL
ncbi:hypothetical protein ABPG77_002121 [Micractinium sp. CCAP 211/92]